MGHFLYMQSYYNEDNDIYQTHEVDQDIDLQDPLTLKLDDDVLINHINKRIDNSQAWFADEKDLFNRREKNWEYYLGEQLNTADFEYYQSPYVDNVIFESLSTIKPIALSRLPDMIVKPGDDDEESKETADSLTKIVNTDIRKRENRKVLGVAFQHLPLFYTGVVKAIWDPQKGDSGDYRFKVVHPDNIVVDHTSTDNSSDNMDFVAESVELSVKEIIMMFPKKKEEILESIGFDNEDEDSKNEKRLASKKKIWEVWFTWWDKSRDPDTDEMKFERIEGVAWKMDKIVLNKMKNPYWDWSGEKRLFTYDMNDGSKREPSQEEIRRAVFGEDEVKTETIFHNHFKNPRKPYMFMGYYQFGKMPYDETSVVEQVLLMQDNLNKRGRQITEMNDRAAGKDYYSNAYLDKDTVELMDPKDPNEAIVGTGDVRAGHTHVPGVVAPAQLYSEQSSEKQKIFSKMGTHATTRGELTANKPATSDQIAREQDFGRIDDLVEETINEVAEQMSNWAMQFIKLFYTEDHMVKVLGEDGSVTFTKVNRDLIQDGMEVMVSASGVDKAQRRQEAIEMAGIGLIDPMQFYIDMELSDPKGRAEKLMLFKAQPAMYYQQIVLGNDVQAQTEQLSQIPPEASQQVQPPQQQPQVQPGQGGGGNYRNDLIVGNNLNQVQQTDVSAHLLGTNLV